MSEFEKIEKSLFNALAPMKEHLDKIVLVGGWCPYLYIKYLWRKPLRNIPMTTDIDLGVIETGSRRFDHTVYDKLREAGFAVERIYDKEEEPVEFIYRKGKIELKIEFITSFETSDDTLNRFLGRQLACNRIEAFEILLENPVHIVLRGIAAELELAIPRPETFLFHKGLTFVMRSYELKKNKDLFGVYFILKFYPDQNQLLKAVFAYKKHEFFKSFRKNIIEYLSDVTRPGYLMLRPFLRRWVEENRINQDIRDTFEPLLRTIEK